jgi:hypothetical protein
VPTKIPTMGYNEFAVKTVAIVIPDEVAELLAQDEANLRQELHLLWMPHLLFSSQELHLIEAGEMEVP